MPFKPMLAGPCEGPLTYPKLASPKLDGIRCIVTAMGPVTRKLKPVPNTRLFAALRDRRLVGLDGELIGGEPTDPNAMQASTSAVMRVDSEAPVTFYVFDKIDSWEKPTEPFGKRYADACRALESFRDRADIRVVPQQWVDNDAALADYEAAIVEQGYEGVMLRDPYGLYKFGRSTTREGGLLKMKRWRDTEGTIVSVYEGMHNENEAQKDALGRTKRSTAKAGKVAAGVLGGFVLECADFPGVEVRCAPGVLTAVERATLWEKRDTLPGRVVTFKYQPHGMLNAPRFPGFKAFRED